MATRKMKMMMMEERWVDILEEGVCVCVCVWIFIL